MIRIKTAAKSVLKKATKEMRSPKVKALSPKDDLGELESYCKKMDDLSERIKARALKKSEIWDIFQSLVKSLTENTCGTAEAYEGEYAEVMPLFLEHYNDVARPERLAVYRNKVVNRIMLKLHKEVMLGTVKDVRPEMIKLMLNYFDPKRGSEQELDQVIKVIVKEI